MPASFIISDLRRRPEFLGAVAMRIWQAWWRDSGQPLDYIRGHLRYENLDADPIPFALVAHEGREFLGTWMPAERDVGPRHLSVLIRDTKP